MGLPYFFYKGEQYKLESRQTCDIDTQHNKYNIIPCRKFSTLHCPLCSKPAKRIVYSYYCKDCDVDFDENKRLKI